MTRDLRLDYELHGTTAEVALTGDLDMAGAFKLEPAIERMVAETTVDRLVVDLAGVEFIDSAGVGSLVSTQDRLSDLGIDARFRSPSDAVRRVLDVSGVRDIPIV